MFKNYDSSTQNISSCFISDLAANGAATDVMSSPIDQKKNDIKHMWVRGWEISSFYSEFIS